MEELTACTDIAQMKTTLERLNAKVAMLEDKCEDLDSRSRRTSIRIIGVEDGPGSCSPTTVASLLKEAFVLEKEQRVVGAGAILVFPAAFSEVTWLLLGIEGMR